MDKKRASLDEITNISFNYETTQQQQANNTNNSFKDNKNISATNLTLLNQSDDAHSGVEEIVFDELAMLCSGQFKQGNFTLLIILVFF